MPKKSSHKKSRKSTKTKKGGFTKTTEIPVLTRRVKKDEEQSQDEHNELRLKISAAVNEVIPDLIEEIVKQLSDKTSK